MAEQLKNNVFQLDGKCGLQLFVDAYPGIVTEVSGVECISRMPGVVKILQKHSLGYEIPDSGDVKQRLFEIVTVTENSKEAVSKLLQDIEANLSVKDSLGKELLTPMINVERLFG